MLTIIRAITPTTVTGAAMMATEVLELLVVGLLVGVAAGITVGNTVGNTAVVTSRLTSVLVVAVDGFRAKKNITQTGDTHTTLYFHLCKYTL